MSSRIAWRLVAVVGLVLVSSSAVLAQPLVDPRRAEFAPSGDHSTVENGAALLTSYRLDIFVAGQSAVTRSVNLGKPAPETDGMIRVDFVALLTTPLSGGVTYEARIAAVGPGGETSTGVSNTFSFTPVCAPAISPASRSVAATSTTGSVTVTADAGCPWTAASNASWLTVTSGASGSGTGSVGYSVAANTGASSRTGTLTVAGATFTVTQAGVSCTYAISPASQSVAAGGGTASVTVTAGAGCTWTAQSNASWLTIAGGASGTANGSTTITIAANATTSSRTGTVTIAGKTFTATQSGMTVTTPTKPTNLRIVNKG